MNSRYRLLTLPLLLAALGACKHTSKGDIVIDEGVGITAVRGTCPAVGIPDYTGDVTLFSQPGSTDASAIDLVATITNLRTHCDDSGDTQVHSSSGFLVQARRHDTQGARDVNLPYFVTVLRGGKQVVSKRLGLVTLHFADGQARAEVRADGAATIDKAAATLPQTIRDRITKKRKAGDVDAAVDPLADPAVIKAVDSATFEVLIGFQLTDQQLTYNATR